MKKYGIIIGIVALLIIGAIIYFVVIRKKAGQGIKGQLGLGEPGSPTPVNPPTRPTPDLEVTDKLPPVAVNPSPRVSASGVPENLSWVRQRKVAEYLSTLLQENQIDELIECVKMIEEEQEKDETAFPEGNGGLYGQVSDIAHALYLMKVWNNSVLENLKNAQE